MVPDVKLLPAAPAWARDLSAGAPSALALAKSVMDRSLAMSFEDVLAEGSTAQAMRYTSADDAAEVERRRAPFVAVSFSRREQR